MPRAIRLTVDDLRAIAEYDDAVFDRFVGRVRRLPNRAAFRKRGIGHESLFETLVHILNVREVWLAYIVRGRTSDAEIDALFADPVRRPSNWRQFAAYRRRVRSETATTLAGLSAAGLGRRAKIFWMPGRYSVRDGFLQVTIEQAHHLGEIIGALWQDDRAPPEMTWIGVRRGLGRSR